MSAEQLALVRREHHQRYLQERRAPSHGASPVVAQKRKFATMDTLDEPLAPAMGPQRGWILGSRAEPSRPVTIFFKPSAESAPAPTSLKESAASTEFVEKTYEFLRKHNLDREFLHFLAEKPERAPASASAPTSATASTTATTTTSFPPKKIARTAPAPAPAASRGPICGPSRLVPPPTPTSFAPIQSAPAPTPAPASEEFQRILHRLRAPITGNFHSDEAPWDVVQVYGYPIHRFQCAHRDANGEQHEMIGVVSAELAALLGNRIDEMRDGGGVFAANGGGGGDEELQIDARVFVSLRNAGVGAPERRRTRTETTRALEANPPLTPLNLALALMRLREFKIVTLARAQKDRIAKNEK